jgi:2,4-dienoyl-CoA reductase-like NADH-dependent reductase (Old Yellow Enzyme family)
VRPPRIGADAWFPKPGPRRRLAEQEIKAIVDKFADVARVLINADPDGQG